MCKPSNGMELVHSIFACRLLMKLIGSAYMLLQSGLFRHSKKDQKPSLPWGLEAKEDERGESMSHYVQAKLSELGRAE